MPDIGANNSAIGLINIALTRIDADHLESIELAPETDRPEGSFAKRIAPMAARECLAMHEWTFATKRKKLTPEVSPDGEHPLINPADDGYPEYKYKCRKPSDCLEAQDVLYGPDGISLSGLRKMQLARSRSSAMGRYGRPYYVDAGDFIYCCLVSGGMGIDVEQNPIFTLKYTSFEKFDDATVQSWRSGFGDAVAWRIAWELAIKFAGAPSLQQLCERSYRRSMEAAIALDAERSPPSNVWTPSLYG